MRRLLLAGICIFVGSCVAQNSPQPGTAPITAPNQPKDALPELIAQDDAMCASYGLKFGTSDYAQCRMNLLQMRSAADSQTSAQAWADKQRRCSREKSLFGVLQGDYKDC